MLPGVGSITLKKFSVGASRIIRLQYNCDVSMFSCQIACYGWQPEEHAEEIFWEYPPNLLKLGADTNTLVTR